MLCNVLLCYAMLCLYRIAARTPKRPLVSANSLGPLEEVPVAPPRMKKRQSMPHFTTKLDDDDVTRSQTPQPMHPTRPSLPEVEVLIQPGVAQAKTQCGHQLPQATQGAGSSISFLFTKLIGKFRASRPSLHRLVLDQILSGQSPKLLHNVPFYFDSTRTARVSLILGENLIFLLGSSSHESETIEMDWKTTKCSLIRIAFD